MSTLGQGIELKFLDDTFRIAAMGPNVRSNFSRWFKGYAWNELDKMRTVIDSNRFSRLEGQLMQAMAAGHYEWGGVAHLEAQQNEIGGVGHFLARLRVFHPDMSEALARRIAESLGWERIFGMMDLADGPDTSEKKDEPPKAADPKAT